MFKKTESLAWLILILSFTVCITLAIGVPLGIRAYVLNSTRPLTIELQPRAGAVTLQEPGSTATVLVQSSVEIEPRTRITLDAEGDALLVFYTSDRAEGPLATIQLYNETDLTVEWARTPRFASSHLMHNIQLNVAYALNMRPSVGGDGRPVSVRVDSPQGPIDLEEGFFVLVVSSDQTDVSVSAGRASIVDPVTGKALALVPPQRTQITAGGLGEISIGERNILSSRNGAFAEPLQAYWTVYTDTAYPEEDGGSVSQLQLEDNAQVYFSRAGQSHAETGIRQVINQDIREIKSLRVRARIRIDTQTLPACGTVGSECPIMLHIDFLDQNSGGTREWLQGFYAREGDDDAFCTVCQWKAEHTRVSGFGVWYDYESEDLLPLLRAQGIEPAAIQLVEIYASGWTYGSAIDELAILVGE